MEELKLNHCQSEDPEFKYNKTLGVVIGIDNYDKLVNQNGDKLFKRGIDSAGQTILEVKKCFTDLQFDEIRTYFNMTHVSLKMALKKLIKDLKKAQENSNTANFLAASLAYNQEEYDKAIEFADKIIAIPYTPSKEALDNFDQKKSFNKILDLISE